MKKIMLFGAVVLGFGLAGCSSQEKEVSTPAPTPVEQTVESTVESEPQVDNTQAVLAILQEGYSEIGTVHYDKSQEAYIITPTDSAFVQDLEYTLNSGNTASWDELVDAFATLSENITETVGSGTSIAMANPVKTSNVILVITDGVVVYDAVNESVNQ